MEIEEDIDDLYEQYLDEWLDDNNYEKLYPMDFFDEDWQNSTPSDIAKAVLWGTNYGHENDSFSLTAEYYYYKGDGNMESVESCFLDEWRRDQISEERFAQWCVDQGYATEVLHRVPKETVRRELEEITDIMKNVRCQEDAVKVCEKYSINIRIKSAGEDEKDCTLAEDNPIQAVHYSVAAYKHLGDVIFYYHVEDNGDWNVEVGFFDVYDESGEELVQEYLESIDEYEEE